MTTDEGVYVLTDSSKFEQRGTVTEFSFDDVATVYTDQAIQEKTKQLLRNKNVEAFTV